MAFAVQNFILASTFLLIAGFSTGFSGHTRAVLIVHTQGNNDRVSAAFKVNSNSASDQETGDYNGILAHASNEGFRVRSLRNQNLVEMQILKDRQSQFIQIKDTGFIQFQGKDYVVPKHLLVHAQQLSNKGDIASFVHELSHHSVNLQSAENSFKSAVHRLASVPESHLILQACEGLGNEGITGASHPQMLPLYVFATRMSHATNMPAAQNLVPDNKKANEQCTAPTANKCLGMCGYECQCWKFICGDCCTHHGCYLHDVCCREKPFSSFCLTPFLYGFNCNNFGGYPQCLKNS